MSLKKQYNSNNVIFYLAYFLLVASSSLYSFKFYIKSPNIIYMCGFLLLILLFVIQLIKQRYISYKSFIIGILVIFLLVMSKIATDDALFLILFLLLFTFKDIKFDNFLKKDLYIRIFFLILVTLLYILNLTLIPDIYREEYMRYSFGYTHPNYFGFNIMVICFEYFYLFYKKYDYKIILILILLNFIVIYFANSRASFLGVLICIFLIFIKNDSIKRILENKKIKFLIINLPIIVVLLTLIFYLLYKYRTGIGLNLDSFFSGRLYWIETYLSNYNINLLGNEVLICSKITNVLGKTYLTIDNSYAYLLIKYGLIIFCLVIYLFRKLFVYMYQNKKYTLICIFSLLILYGIMEKMIFIPWNNPFLLIFSSMLFNNYRY